MNTWPALKVWSEFAGALALEFLLLFAVARLISWRVHCVQWRRTLWQMVLVAMLLAFAGELSGVRGSLRPPEKNTVPVKAARAVVITVKNTDLPVVPVVPLQFSSLLALEGSSENSAIRDVLPNPTHRIWPALIWLAPALTLFLRVIAAQLLTLAFRLPTRRWHDGELNERLTRLARLLHIDRPVLLARGFRSVAPFTFGVWQPVVVLPQRFKELFTPQQREVALAHELAHVAGFDTAWRTLAHLLCALLWWNPFVWLVKRQLDRASEFAADEASLLTPDGPGHLAECLVQCAQSPHHPALPAWLSMDGNFRSALGQRVARLLLLQPHDFIHRRVPWYLRVILPGLCVALLWIGMEAMKPASSNGSTSWRGSILGSAFAATSVEPKTNFSTDTNRIAVARFIQDGKLYFETGRLDEARTNLLEALRLDPTNETARYYLDLTSVRGVPLAGKRDGTHTSVERERIYQTLRRVRLPEWGPFDNLPLSEVIKQLNDAIHRRDTNGQRINFFVSLRGAASVDAAGLPIQMNDISSVRVRLGAKLRDLTVEEVLNILTTIAEQRVQYSVEDYGVIIAAKGEEAVPLHTRFFKVDPNSFQHAIQSLVSINFKTGETNRPFKDVGELRDGIRTTVTNAGAVFPTVRSLFQSAGVDLSAAGKAVLFNDRLGTLMVRATIADLDTIEKVIQMLNMSPPQLTIQVKAIEVNQDDSHMKGLDSFLGAVTNKPTGAPDSNGSASTADNLVTSGLRNTASTTNTASVLIRGILTDGQFRSIVRAMEQSGGSDLMSAPAVTTLSGRQAQIKVVDIRYIVTRLDFETNNAPDQPLIRPVAEPFELGPMVDVVPWVEPDGFTIQMTVLPQVKEFLGYDEPEGIWAAGGPLAPQFKGVTEPLPLPRFRVRQAAATARIYDGQTLVLSAGTVTSIGKQKRPDAMTVAKGAGITQQQVAEYETISARLDVLRTKELGLRAKLSDENPVLKQLRKQIADNEERKKSLEVNNPKLAALFSAQPAAPSTKALFFFITARLIDPAGNPLHTDEQLRERHKGVPSVKATLSP